MGWLLWLVGKKGHYVPAGRPQIKGPFVLSSLSPFACGQ
jgi:hypothetical protein